MKKRMTALALAALMVMGTVAAAAGAEKTITVTPMSLSVDGQVGTPTKSDGTPAEVFAYQGATYAPLRYLTELNGNQVIWDKNDPSTAKISTDFVHSVDWSAEYDVVVIGYGMAGATTAIQAADEGAKVLLLEKAAQGHEGGNSRYAGQGFVTVDADKRDEAVEYFKRIRGMYNTPSDDILEAFTDGIISAMDWVKERGGNPLISHRGIGEFKDIEGWDLMNAWSINGKTWDAGAYKWLQGEVAERSDSIDIWFEAPGKHLIQDADTGIIHGVVAEVDGKEYNIRAKNGVVLCTGGYENNQQMIQDFLQLPYGYSKGALYNTGDGIKMAMEVGADLWHMGNIAGPDLNAIDENGRAYGYSIQGVNPNLSTSFTTNSVIYVGPDGTRFVDESVIPGHGFIDYHGQKLRMPTPMPAYCVFDAKALDKTIYKAWGEDKSDEIEKGIIIEAKTLSELTKKLGLPEGSLEATVKQYNEFCAKGEDIQLGRNPDMLIPLDKGPYYAFEVFPTFTNTQGGPRRNAEGSVIDTNGDPIPHLYSAGECGSIWGDIYQGAGNLGECLVFGRISGANAAKAKTDVYAGSVMEGKTPVNFVAKEEATVSTGANEYVGVGSGMGGDVKVKVTMDGKTIKAVEILSHNESPVISDTAIAEMPGRIVKANSTEVDGISGATTTSNAIKAAVENALAQVK